ncbi:MAG: hypothetical protein GC181_12895 [Bacteroidetes bacterium]|nr:hypothetical protein [Bacteroidota bacterium]
MKKHFEFIWVAVLLFFQISCVKTHQTNNEIHNQFISSDSALNLISDLPEILLESDNISKRSNGTNHLISWIETSPDTSGNPYYEITVGEDNGNSVAELHHFHVYGNPVNIMYYDILSDEEISLKKWRNLFQNK